jgi:hypothetical protein
MFKNMVVYCSSLFYTVHVYQQHNSMVLYNKTQNDLQGIKLKSFVMCFGSYTSLFNSAVPTADIM